MSGIVLYAVLVAFGLLTGAAAGLLGVGGGILIVPFLTLVAGVPQHAAQATSLLVILPTAIAGSLVLRRRGVGNLGTALRFGIFGAAGGAVGAVLALQLSGHSLRVVFAIFIAAVGLRLVRDGLRARNASA